MSTKAPLRVGFIGAGGIAGDHLRAYETFPDRVRVAAVCDVNEEVARKFAAEAGVEAVYTDAETMLAEAAIDAVAVCTTHNTHAQLALAAIAAGRHVLVEKPLATTLGDCRAMVDAADKAGVTLMVGQNHRYVPTYRRAHQIVREGELGTVRAARCDAMQNLPEFVTGHWLLDGEIAGGGVIPSLAVHPIDLLRYIVGDVKRVTALTRTSRSEFVNGAEDYAAALLEFENGAIGEMFATFSSFRTPWVHQVTVFGDSGVIQTEPYMGESPVETPATAATAKRLPDGPGDWEGQFRGFAPLEKATDLPTDDDMINEVLHFADCCASGAEPISSGRDNLGTMEVVFAIYESARTGAAVELKDLA